jgi:hypothetical protein
MTDAENACTAKARAEALFKRERPADPHGTAAKTEKTAMLRALHLANEEEERKQEAAIEVLHCRPRSMPNA